MNENPNEEIELVIIIVEEDWNENHPHFHTHRHKFTIKNKNDGDVIHVRARDHALISQVIDRMYLKFGITRHPEDRLTCEGGGNVFPHAGQTVLKYIENGHCPRLHWVFAGESGGA